MVTERAVQAQVANVRYILLRYRFNTALPQILAEFALGDLPPAPDFTHPQPVPLTTRLSPAQLIEYNQSLNRGDDAAAE